MNSDTNRMKLKTQVVHPPAQNKTLIFSSTI